MNSLRLLLMALVVAFVSAEHYRGGTFSWKATKDGKVDIQWRLSWARERKDDKKYGTYPFKCSESKLRLDGEGYLICMECTNHIVYPESLYLNCTNWDAKENWITGVGRFIYTPEEGRRHFTLSYQLSNRRGEFNYGSQWIYNMKNYGTAGLAWRMVTTVDLNITNNSPITTHPAMITFIKECGNVSVQIPVTDPDNDDVKCRWTNKDNECPKQACNYKGCSNHRVCGDPFPGATVDENECRYFFPVSQMEPGWYAVPITLEDHRRGVPGRLESGALSKIPLQFLIKVESEGECRNINFENYTQCHTITPGQDWSYELKVNSADVQIIIERPSVDFKVGPLNKNKKKNYSSKVVSWTPKVSDIGKHFVLFHDSFFRNYGNLTILVRKKTTPPGVLLMESYPSPNTEVTPDRKWKIKFDKAVIRPIKPAFITVIDLKTEKVAAKYDVSDKMQVKISEKYPNTLVIDSPYDNLKAGSKYMLKVDAGVATKICDNPCAGGECALVNSIEASWPIKTPPMPEPTVECGPSSLTVYVPLAYVEGVPANALRFIDSCYAEPYNSTHYKMTTGFEECGTIAEEPTPGRLIFKNIVSDVPKAIAEGLPVTRTQRTVKINVTCEVKGISYYDVSFTPSDAMEAFAVEGKSRLNTLLKLYEDITYSREYRKEDLPKSVKLKRRLFFGLEAVDKAKALQIISCTAIPRRTPRCKGERYTFIEDGCPVDSTFRFEQTNSGYEKRFSIKAFSFLFYRSTEEVLVKCKAAICNPDDMSSLCTQVLTKQCSDAILRAGVNDVIADVTLPVSG
ncbi:uncharacterized protein LOC117106817 [Anneissia japonica]|uniref:uncharacterized protein LOC117106817 n=1 Tax=Anneissia japonica TaxID=1529436 RepID=UPI0014257B36|nr:uncharacterized protein LOC117106817 [Anneissia japonica]